MTVYIQKITTTWTKKSRGNPGASQRNAVPEKLPVSRPSLNEPYLVQETYFTESTDFKKPVVKPVKKLQQDENSALFRRGKFGTVAGLEDNVLFTPTENGMEIHLLSEQNRKKRTGELGFNQWCQVKTNRRYVLEDTWGYSKTVYNIFYGDVLKMESIMNTAEKTFLTDLQKLLY